MKPFVWHNQEKDKSCFPAVIPCQAVSERVRVKASGGIRNLDTVLSAYAAGAARCGVSATEAIMVEAIKREAEGTLILPENLTEMSGGY